MKTHLLFELQSQVSWEWEEGPARTPISVLCAGVCIMGKGQTEEMAGGINRNPTRLPKMGDIKTHYYQATTNPLNKSTWPFNEDVCLAYDRSLYSSTGIGQRIDYGSVAATNYGWIANQWTPAYGHTVITLYL